MWQSRRDLIRACTLALVVAACLGACFTVVLFSWPDQEPRSVAVSSDLQVSVGGPIIDGADVVPSTFQTGSIDKRQTAGFAFR